MGSIVWLVLVGSGLTSAGTWTPTADMVVGAGHESDLVLIDGPDTRAVPGGGFAELRAMALGTLPHPGLGHLRLGVHGTMQRFLDDDGRRLASGGLFAEYRRSVAGRWYLDLGGRTGAYDDESRPEARRLDAAGHIALGYAGDRWALEAGAGTDGVKFPDFQVAATDGAVDVLTESATNGFATLTLDLGHTVFARLEAGLRDADAVVPFYHSHTRSLGLTLWAPIGERGRLSLGIGERAREYPDRSPDNDDDRWRHVGITYGYSLADRWRLQAEAGAGEYRDFAGNLTEHGRVSLAVGWRPWDRAAAPDPRLPARDGDPIRFRHRAQDARQVSLVGEFNGWDPAADPMTLDGDGWWETTRFLPAGSWQYCYLVDGIAVPPTDADVLVNDGFGSQNGLIAIGRTMVTSTSTHRPIGQRPEDEPSDGPGDDQE